MIGPLKSRRAWWLVAISIVLLLSLIAIVQIDARAVLDEIRRLSAVSLLGASGLLVLGALLAAVRLWFISSDIGTPLNGKQALLALCVGQIVGAISVQYFGQIAARSALLGRSGVSAPAHIAMVTYERLVAVAVSGLMAAGGATYLFGHFAIDTKGGGTQLLTIIGGMAAAIVGGAGAAWGPALFQVLWRALNVRTLIVIARISLLTVMTQLTTAGAYVIIAHSISEQTSLAALFFASFIVMFAASLPISFSGWGVRELSAVLALGAVGIKASAAVAIAVTLGALALGAVIFLAGVAVIWPAMREIGATRSATETGSRNIAAVLNWTVPLAAATAVFFQIYVPVGATNLNVNLADPVVILGAALFLYGHAWPSDWHWRFPALNLAIVIATTVLTISFLHGYLVFGWSDWAVTNRFLGWFVLLCYGMTGALIVRHAKERGAAMFARTFVASATAIVLFALALVIVNARVVSLPPGMFTSPMEGFSQNRNAFSFLLLLAIAAMPMMSRQFMWVALAVLMLGLWFAGSRAALGTFVAVAGLMIYIKAISLRVFCFAVLGFSAGLFLTAALFYIPSLSAGSASSVNITIVAPYSLSDPSNVQRLESILGGLKLFLSHPIFGAGLGYFMDEQVKAGTPLVIHSTPVWLLAETGLVGFAAYVIPAALIFLREWRRHRDDAAAQTVIITLSVFTAMSSVHELLYQRSLWLVLGVAMYLVARPISEDQTA
jgi:hypothetical protein